MASFLRNIFSIDVLGKKRFIFIVGFVFLLGAGTAFITRQQEASHNSTVKQPYFGELSSEEYTKIKKEFLLLVNKHAPRLVLTELRRRINSNSALMRSCHALVHEIGRESYEKYNDFAEAIKYSDEICNSGYLHGVIEAHFLKSSDVFSEMMTLCNSYPPGKYLSWECYHGIGHGVMYYTSNNLPKSLELCDKYANSFSRVTCANGVFMENFNTDQKLHPSEFLKKDDPFYPCKEQSTRHRGDCYLYAPTYYLSLHKNDYVGALKWCDNAEHGYKYVCVQGVGGQAIKENINFPKFVEGICMSGEASEVSNCISGMVGLLINHYGSLSPVRELCGELEPSNKKTCAFSVQLNSGLFD